VDKVTLIIYQIEEGAEVNGHPKDKVDHSVAAEEEDPDNFGGDAERERSVAHHQNPTLKIEQSNFHQQNCFEY
jgi:hypothetical protein